MRQLSFAVGLHPEVLPSSSFRGCGHQAERQIKGICTFLYKYMRIHQRITRQVSSFEVLKYDQSTVAKFCQSIWEYQKIGLVK